MEQTILVTGLQVDDLVSRIGNYVINNLPQPQPAPEPQAAKQSDKYLSRLEVCELFHISLVTLNKHTKSGRLKAKRIGSRVLYNKYDIDKALSSNNI